MYSLLLDVEELKLLEKVREFVRSVPADLLKRMDSGEVDYPREYLESAAKERLIGLRFPEKWGGRGQRWVMEAAAIEEVGALGSALGCLYSLPSIIGESVNTFGTDEQKKKYLAGTLAGELTCAEALTEPRGGSDFFGSTTTAELKGDRFILNGQKRFVVGSQGADYFFVYARSNLDPKVPGHEALSALLVDRSDNIEVGAKYNLLGSRGGGTGRIVFREVEVPKENLVGPLHGGAMVFNRMMVPERLTSAAGAIGTARAALEIAARYSDRRRAFGRKIRKFQAVSFQVADSLSALDAARALTAQAALAADAETKNRRRIVSEAKKVATATGWQVVNAAMQVMGGIAYTDIYPIERLLRDARLSMIWTGTNEIMSLLIQHEYYKEILEKGPAGRDIEGDAPSAHMEEDKLPDQPA